MRVDGRKQKGEGYNKMLFTLYIIIVLVLAVIYFTRPERPEFLQFQLKWWGQMLDVVKGG